MKTETRCEIEILPYEDSMYAHCVALLAEAFVHNPMHIRVFGDDVLRKNRVFFSAGLASFRGHRLVAVVDHKIVGFVHWAHSKCCRILWHQKLRAFPAMVSGLGLADSLNVLRWLSTWERLDPAEEHLHLGPIAVAPEVRGMGIGVALMKRFCAEADARGLKGYLETDKPENVGFYNQFGFSIAGECDVLRIRSFFMSRES